LIASVNTLVDVLERANNLQKEMKSRFTGGKKKELKIRSRLCFCKAAILNGDYFLVITNLQVSVCLMKRNSLGSYSRDKTPCIEVATTRDKSYDSFAKDAANCHQLRPKKGMKFALFNLKGAMISNGEHSSKRWTVGGYLKILKCGVANFKIGVGYVSESSESSDEVCYDYI